MLRAFVVAGSEDPDLRHAYVQSLEGPFRREILEAGDARPELRHAALDRVDVGLYHGPRLAVMERRREPSSDYLLQFPLTGEFTVEVDGTAHRITPASGVVISPAQVVRRVARGGWTLLLSIRAYFMRARLESSLGRTVTGPLWFHPQLGAAAAEVREYALLLVDSIDRGVARPGSALVETLEEGLVDLVLRLQPHNQGRALAVSEGARREQRIHAVAAYLDAHLDAALTVEDLAEAAECSVRVLQTTFAELCGLRPLEFVRRRRLAAVRRALEQAPGEESIAQIARRCGLPRGGRLSSMYRSIYGESPSATRARALGSPGRR